MTRVLLGLGANLGDRLANMQAALDLMAERGIAPTTVSCVWATAPIPADQPAFLNAAAAVETDLAPHALLAALKEIEALLGRRPERHWGPRPIDLDILFYGDLTIANPDLVVPHPLVAAREFVLAPLAEVEPGSLPVLGGTGIRLLRDLPGGSAVRTGLRLRLPGSPAN